MIREIEQSSPGFIVFVSTATSWMFDETVGNPLFFWMENYLQENYRQVGAVELGYFNGSKYFWDQDAEEFSPVSANFILIYKRDTVS